MNFARHARGIRPIHDFNRIFYIISTEINSDSEPSYKPGMSIVGGLLTAA